MNRLEVIREAMTAEAMRIAAVKNYGLEIASVENLGDVTPERLAHARANGLTADIVEIKSGKGFSTGTKYRKIDNAIDAALKRKWINFPEWAAGDKFLHILYHAQLSPRMIANMEMPVDGSRSIDLSDYRITCMQKLGESLEKLSRKQKDAWLSWTMDVLHTDSGIAQLGQRFSKAKHAQSQIRMGKIKLKEICGILAKHYGL